MTENLFNVERMTAKKGGKQAPAAATTKKLALII